MSRRYTLGPDRHGTVSTIWIHSEGCEIEIRSPKLPLPVMSFGSRDSMLKLVEDAIADTATDPTVCETCRVVAAYLLQPTANGN